MYLLLFFEPHKDTKNKQKAIQEVPKVQKIYSFTFVTLHYAYYRRNQS